MKIGALEATWRSFISPAVDSAITERDWRAERARIMDVGTVRLILWWAPKLPCEVSDRTLTVVFASGLFGKACSSLWRLRQWRFG
jgi:hypothetical protein